jgi:hypothetical protein
MEPSRIGSPKIGPEKSRSKAGDLADHAAKSLKVGRPIA